VEVYASTHSTGPVECSSDSLLAGTAEDTAEDIGEDMEVGTLAVGSMKAADSVSEACSTTTALMGNISVKNNIN